MRKPRFFVNQSIGIGTIFQLDAEASHHIKNSLRLRTGDEIIVVMPNENAYQCRIHSISSRKVSAEVIDFYVARSESPLHITLGIALIPGRKIDMIIRQASELGVSKICPFQSRYSQFSRKQQEKRMDRWKKIIKSACQQAGRTRLVSLENIVLFEDILTKRSPSLGLIAWENEHENSIKDIYMEDSKVRDIFVLVGPEGGFTNDEVKKAKEAGFIPFSLGPRILRCETATIVSVAIIQHHWGDLDIFQQF